MFKNFGVHHFVTQNEVKANYAERAIKTIKGRIYKFFTHKQTHRYIDILQDVTGAYNNSVHRSIHSCILVPRSAHSWLVRGDSEILSCILYDQ